jgi:hypothetical protein
MSELPAIYPIVAMMGISLASGLMVFWLPQPFRGWIDDASRLKRWISRCLLFFAAFLAPCSLVIVVGDELLKITSLSEAFLSLPLRP